MMLSSYTQLELAITPEVIDTAWHQSQTYATPRSQWTAFLNQVCLDTVLPWLQVEYLPQATLALQAWELVNGTAIECDRQRFIFIPDKSLDTSQFNVPQEWIDIPSWVGDYYFAIQVNPDEQHLCLWAYTTHEQLKNQGSYDAFDRTYNLSAPSLVSDLTVLWVMRELGESTQAEVPSLPSVPITQAENLLSRLTSTEINEPRLEIPFSLWGSLLTSESWRERLGRSRQTGTVAPTPVMTQLSQWLQNSLQEMAEGWQTLESLVNLELAASLRQAPSESNSQTVRRLKRLDFDSQPLMLILTLTPDAEKISIQIQLRPEERAQCLPTHLTLSLQTMTHEIIQSVQTGDRYNSIQLRPFKCRSGTQFKVRLEGQALGQTDVLIEEWFQC